MIQNYLLNSIESLPIKKVYHGHWELTEDLIIELPSIVLTIRKGTITDLSSVPKILQWIVPKRGRYDRAAIAHDTIWQNRQRSIANSVMWHIMKVDDVDLWSRTKIYIGLEIFTFLRMFVFWKK